MRTTAEALSVPAESEGSCRWLRHDSRDVGWDVLLASGMGISAAGRLLWVYRREASSWLWWTFAGGWPFIAYAAS
jgi:hypothetical protein